MPISDAYIYIKRYYPSENTLRIVEMAKTSDDGTTIGHFETETEDYQIIAVKNGEVMYKSSIQKIYCAETPCSLTFQTSSSVPEGWSELGNITGLNWKLEYDNTTKLFLFIYDDTTGETTASRLYVISENAKNLLIICNNTYSGSSGNLTCNITGYNGTITAYAYINKTTEILVYTKTIIISSIKQIFDKEGLFFAMMLIMLLGLAGIWNPSVGIILITIGFVTISFLGIAQFGVVTIWSLIIISVILLWHLKS